MCRIQVFVSVAKWMATLANYDLAIGARIHGGLVATAASVPAVVIATDTRIDELAKRVGIPTVRAISLRKHLSLTSFLNSFVRFDGAFFDRNRTNIANNYVHMFNALNVPLSQHVFRIAKPLDKHTCTHAC